MDPLAHIPADPQGPHASGLQLLALSQSSLAAFDQSKAAERLARLEADRELVDRLMLRHYEGPEWTRFASVLAEYGVQVLHAWTCSGAVFVECRKKGFGGLPRVERTSDDAWELAGETVADAIRTFRSEVLIPGVWDPTRGASLKTFFIGQCILRFPNIYRHWLIERDRLQAMPIDPALLSKEKARTDRSLDLREALSRLRPGSAKHIEVAVAFGFEHLEIANYLGISKGALEARLSRYRKKRARAA